MHACTTDVTPILLKFNHTPSISSTILSYFYKCGGRGRGWWGGGLILICPCTLVWDERLLGLWSNWHVCNVQCCMWAPQPHAWANIKILDDSQVYTPQYAAKSIANRFKISRGSIFLHPWSDQLYYENALHILYDTRSFNCHFYCGFLLPEK